MNTRGKQALWQQYFTAALTGAWQTRSDHKPDDVANVCVAIADAALEGALERWPEEPRSSAGTWRSRRVKRDNREGRGD